MNKEHQIMGVYFDPSTRKISSAILQTIEIDAAYVAAVLVTIFDCFVHKVPETHQIAFEQSVLDCFKVLNSKRHELINIETASEL
jgi:hypothetical protein